MARLAVIVLGLAVMGQCEARSLGKKPQALSPPLEDVKSDKKFFGPPFPADYPDDKRPVPDKNILDMVKGPSQPYPALQSKDDYDKDYVKDENSDTGAWQAQFEYDRLRRDLQKAEEMARRAAERAAREGADADGAQKDDDSAAGAVRNAQKDMDEAINGEEKQKTAEDFEGPPSDEKLKELKKAVKDAEQRYYKELLDFKECQKQLENAKKELEDLKAQQKEMEEKLAAETKLWAEQNTVRMNLKKAKETAATTAKAAKVQAALDKLAKAEKVQAEALKVLAKEKAEHDAAKKSLDQHKANLNNAQKKLDNAKTTLQKLHGYKPAEAPSMPKSSASTMSIAALFSLSALVAMCAL